MGNSHREICTCNNQPSSFACLLLKHSHFGVSFAEFSLQTAVSGVEVEFNVGDLISSFATSPLNWLVFLLIQLATLAQRLM